MSRGAVTPQHTASPRQGVGVTMVFELRTTAAVRANTRPLTVAPEIRVMDWAARIVPGKVDMAPRVAELPTCQNTFDAWALPVRLTWRWEAVVSVVAIWKMKTASAFPPASSVRSPEVIASEEIEL